MPLCVMDSPVGRLRIEEKDGAICRIDRTEDEPSLPDTPLLQEAVRQLTAYFEGELTIFSLPVRLEGTPFQRQCWEVLQGIPYGETISYGEQARRIGKPKATRAVGGANHRNPLCIVVPCHRVIGADGSLTGYGEGLDMKRWLLAHEQAVIHRK